MLELQILDASDRPVGTKHVSPQSIAEIDISGEVAVLKMFDRTTLRAAATKQVEKTDDEGNPVVRHEAADWLLAMSSAPAVASDVPLDDVDAQRVGDRLRKLFELAEKFEQIADRVAPFLERIAPLLGKLAPLLDLLEAETKDEVSALAFGDRLRKLLEFLQRIEELLGKLGPILEVIGQEAEKPKQA